MIKHPHISHRDQKNIKDDVLLANYINLEKGDSVITLTKS